jgi:hypothetical protein
MQVIYQIYQGYDFKLKGTVISLQKPVIKEIWIWTMTIIGNYIYKRKSTFTIRYYSYYYSYMVIHYGR